MYKVINGWTKEKMKAQIREKNNGTKSRLDNESNCAYRGYGNNACAAGCFIPDHLYGEIFESNSIYVLIGTGNLSENIFPLDKYGMNSMQKTHDCLSENTDMRDVLCNWVDQNCED